MFKKSLTAMAVLMPAALLSTTASAELFGLQHGRVATPVNSAPMSVEAGVNFGDYSTYGLRLNYRLSDLMTVYGDLGMTELDLIYGGNPDGISYGVGMYYYMMDQRFVESLDMALHASFHMAPLEAPLYDLDVSNIMVDVLFSGREPLNENLMNWYASVGLGRLDLDVDDNIELAFSGGVTMPLSGGEIYGGIDYEDEMMFGAGFRYNLR